MVRNGGECNIHVCPIFHLVDHTHPLAHMPVTHSHTHTYMHTYTKMLLAGSKPHYSGMIGRFKCDGVTERLNVYEIADDDQLTRFIEENINFYTR